jgi:hypothetical protein
VSAAGLPAESGYTHGFTFLLVVAVLAAGAAVVIPSVRRARVVPATPVGLVPVAREPVAGEPVGGH